jgi:agmatine/peptidylarginine deiminase
MKKLFTHILSISLLVSLTTATYGQSGLTEQPEKTTEVEFLPKYLTTSERAIIDAQMEAYANSLLERGPLSSAQREAGTCVGSCGGQSAPNSCWCDDLCVQYGDCCDDIEEACGGTTPTPVTPTPDGLMVPGEFEESQAVVLRWPYSSTTSSRTRMYAELIDAIQQEVPAWIFINFGGDSITVKNALNFYGVTLTNYDFKVKQTNSIWSRDYGPWGFYYGTDDELAFIDLQYYTTRPLDNQVPAWLANEMGIELYTTDMYTEGGNIMVDGFGHIFYSDVIFGKNASQNGWSTSTTREVHNDLFNATNFTETERLLCDGGTGHIDMYAKLLDEQTILASEYPSVVTASDKQRIEDNVDLFNQEFTTFGNGFDVIRIPMPRRDDGSFSTSCSQINADARGFVNGLFVNKTLIIPIYTNENSSQSNKNWDEAALDLVREVMPGYNVVGIDARSLTTSGGAIHCITMQIPTDNPVRFRHARVEGLQPAVNQYNFTAEITNKSGISIAQLFWKVKNTASWNALPMSVAGGTYEASLNNPGFTANDTIVYYIEASTNNGKTMSKPIVAPDGFFEFYFDQDFDNVNDCEVPANLSTTNIGSASATLNWTPVAGATGYVIRGTVQGSSNFQEFTLNNGSASSFNVNILAPNADYQWQIRTNCDGGGQSDWSLFSLFSTNACIAPSGLNVSNTGATSAILNWSAVPGATGYQVRGRPIGAGGYQLIDVGAGATSLNTGNQLVPLTNYEWSVRTYCNPAKTATSPWPTNNIFSTGAGIGQMGGGDMFSQNSMELFPNPSEGRVFASINGADDDFVIIIRDMTGREVFKKQYASSNDGGVIEFQLGHLSKGVYLVQMVTNNEQLVQRLVIQ